MTIIEQAINYYVKVTGKEWHSFFNNLDTALKGDLDEQEGDEWLIHALTDTLIANGINIEDLKYNKDSIKAFFDDEGRKSNGEFFTPEVWAKEGRTYFDKYISNWKEDYYVWDISAGTGNLLKTIEMKDRSKLFMSTLQDDDISILKNTSVFEKATSFKMDFLDSIVLEELDNRFINNLPENLQDVILNDKPLIIYANPPYKAGKNKATEVGRFMSESREIEIFDFEDFSPASYDIFYQFCFQVMCLIIRYKLKNTYFGFFGPLRFFFGKSAGVLLKHFEHVFEFLDGMCLSANEFNDIGKEVEWGIGYTLWKSRGDYLDDPMAIYHKDILLERKYTNAEGEIESNNNRILYEEAKTSLREWTEPDPNSVLFAKKFPLMTSWHTFKGGNPYEKVYYATGKVYDNFLGTLMTQTNLSRSSRKCGILSAPTTIEYINITEENFWRCVANYGFRQAGDNVDWSITKKDISAPNTSIEGYDDWVYNCLPLFLFGYKSHMTSLRNVTDPDGVESFNIYNNFFYITKEEVKEYCHDEKVLADLEVSPSHDFIIEQIEKAIPHLEECALDLYNWCKSYTLATYDYRNTCNYNGGLECWDAGFQQVRGGIWKEALEDEYRLRISKLRDFLRKDMFKWGFLSDIEE